MPETVVDRIDALLPQTQCTRCGYVDCRAYAEAVANGDAALNRCAPGGIAVIAAMAKLLNRPMLPLDSAFGTDDLLPVVAFVRESECIGCYKCAAICPVDAFIGAPRHMHTVIESECTGCGLCLPVCPVDCIDIRQRSVDNLLASARAPNSRRRYYARRQRKAQQELERNEAHSSRRRENDRILRIDRYLEAARLRARGKRERSP